MAETTLEWKLESINFDELKLTLTESMQERIGDNHCKLCVLASGPMCIKRSVCRIFYNEVWINKEITEIKPPAPHIIEYADVYNFMESFVRERGFRGKKFPTNKEFNKIANKEFEGREMRCEEYISDAYYEIKKELQEFYDK